MKPRIIEYEELDSTNDEAKRLVRAAFFPAAPDAGPAGADTLYGSVVTARRQTAGRGRRGRSFASSGADSIYASFILRPPASVSEQRITAFAAVAVCEAIEKTTSCKPAIKWVNDILVDGKKVCGILAESVAHAVILGIGVNINLGKGDLPEELADVAGSLTMTGDERALFFDALVESVFRCMEATGAADASALMDAYRERSLLTGRRIIISKGDMQRPAFATGIADDGALIIEYEDGTAEALRSSDVSVSLLKL